MKGTICEYCAYKISVRVETSKQSRCKCSCVDQFIRNMVYCPQNYDLDEYNVLLAKGEDYDRLRYEAEQKARKEASMLKTAI